MLLKKTLLASAVVATLFTAGCKDEKQYAQPGLFPVDGNVVATVNGVAITQPQLDEYTNFRNQTGNPSVSPVEELVNLEVLRQAAVKANMDKDAEVRASMSRAATNALANSLVTKQIDNEVSEDELRAEYDSQVAQMQALTEGKAEYQASHILLETEEAAVEVIEALKGGADFAELAKEKSTGPSGPTGGDLGWNSPDTFVPEFGAALESMEVGAISEAPVKTQFGFHVIKLNDKRDVSAPEAPAFDMVKDQLRPLVLQNRMKNYMEELRNAAAIEMTEVEVAPATDPHAGHDHAAEAQEEVAEPATEESAS